MRASDQARRGHAACAMPEWRVWVVAVVLAAHVAERCCGAGAGAGAGGGLYSALDLPEYQEACSRAASRRARNIVRRKVFQALKHAVLEASSGDGDGDGDGDGTTREDGENVLSGMAPQCAFHPSRDRYFQHEVEGKEFLPRSGLWRCPYSGKLFKTERYLDLHLQRFWSNQTGKAPAAEPHRLVCLGDFCDVLRCGGGSGEAAAASHHRRDRRDHLHRLEKSRHRCIATFHSCFPPGVQKRGMRSVHDALVDHFCHGDERALDSWLRAPPGRDGRARGAAARSAPEPPWSTNAAQVLWHTMVAVVFVGSVAFYAVYWISAPSSRVLSPLEQKKRR